MQHTAAQQPACLRTTLLATPDLESLREQVMHAFEATFDRYEQLFEVLRSDEAYYIKPIALRHPLIFYFGHTATFFINKLLLAGLIKERIDQRLESMFAVGVDEMSWDDLDDARYAWPSVESVRDYRRQVREVVGELIRGLPLAAPIGWESPWWIILMGIEHERIHLETSSVLIRQHSLQYVQPHSAWQPCQISGAAPANALVDVPAGQFRLGRDRAKPAVYGWDNEFGVHDASTAPFQVARYLVSNQEFLGFVEGGGYGDDSLWSEEGLAWKRFAGAQNPTFWVREGSSWRLRLMCEEVSMRWDWPVETNCHEARAFCQWKTRDTGMPHRLPTEDEWHVMRLGADIGDLPQSSPAPANIELDHWASSCPVTLFAHGPFYDLIGNVWQWLETPTYAYAGFEVHPIYDDFTTPTFDDRHNLIKGGSWISCGNEALPTSRYAFRRHFFQHAGFRYVVSAAPAEVPHSQYETDRSVSEYCEFHFGDSYFGVPNFPRTLAELAIQAMGSRPARSALDLGCATGRASFELARHFDRVTGIDFSARFIGVGAQMAAQGRVRYVLVDEGELVAYKERSLADIGLDDVAHKVEFFQGDACNLKTVFAGFDLILAANLIDRLYSPAQFLRTVHERLNPGGLLVIASPYTWLLEHTKREEWIGGFKKDGESFTTLDGLKLLLGPHFQLMRTPVSVPFVIRETLRKHQHTLSEVTIWQRL